MWTMNNRPKFDRQYRVEQGLPEKRWLGDSVLGENPGFVFAPGVMSAEAILLKLSRVDECLLRVGDYHSWKSWSERAHGGQRGQPLPVC